jgi:hypothetical protein
MNPLATFQARFPNSDFTIYFRNIEACRTVKGLDTHDHHICPRAQFPEYEDFTLFPENKVTVSIEDHDFLHKLLEATCGIKAPSTAYFEAQKGGKSWRASLRARKENGTNIYSREHQRKAARAGAQKGGLIGGRKGGLSRSPAKLAALRELAHVNKNEKRGIFGITVEQRRLNARKAGLRNRELKRGIFARSPEQMSKDGRKAALCLTREQRQALGRKMGSIMGRRNVENGHLARLRTSEHQSMASKAANHKRWHARRSIVNPNCSLCNSGYCGVSEAVSSASNKAESTRSQNAGSRPL